MRRRIAQYESLKETGELPGRVRVRSSQYLNNLIEQEHRRVKQRIRPMLGFKRFDNAAVTVSGIELAEEAWRRWDFITFVIAFSENEIPRMGARTELVGGCTPAPPR